MSSLLEYVTRRQKEFIQYLSTIKTNQLYEEVQSFVSDKISETSTLINTYQEQIALITRQGFPELVEVNSIIEEYAKKINTIKLEVAFHVDNSAASEENKYHILHYWEEHITMKKEQSEFFLASLLHKLHKMIIRIQEQESDMFDLSLISHIQQHASIINSVRTLSEEELQERKTTLHSQLQQLETR